MYGAMSDDTNHGAATIYANLEPVMQSFINAGKKTILISDTALPWYRNKSIFLMVQSLALKWKVTVRWIYLELGHT